MNFRTENTVISTLLYKTKFYYLNKILMDIYIFKRLMADRRLIVLHQFSISFFASFWRKAVSNCSQAFAKRRAPQ